LLLDICSNQVPHNARGNILSPAALAWLKFDCRWDRLAADCAQLVETVYPKTLPRLFPFPDIHAQESRTRPAYYYKQSSVIPYRISAGSVEVLIVSSSKNKHWVIPKGIQDPGMSAQQSAAEEAYEEAGIKGSVASDAIGIYRYPKWDAVCDVTVYAMQVEHVLGETQWQESHRGRQWVSIEQAVELLKNDDVKQIVNQLPQWLKEQAS